MQTKIEEELSRKPFTDTFIQAEKQLLLDESAETASKEQHLKHVISAKK